VWACGVNIRAERYWAVSEFTNICIRFVTSRRSIKPAVVVGVVLVR
jgi:hypothetical protein